MNAIRGKSKVTPQKARKSAKNGTKKAQPAPVETKKRPTPPKGKPPPRPKFEPTKEQRNIVTLAVGAAGMTHDQVRRLILNPETGRPISEGTLREAFADELANAKAQVVAAVAGNLVTVAKNKDHKNCITAAIFFLKCQAGWREPEPEWMVAKRQREEMFDQGGAEIIDIRPVLEERRPALTGPK